MSLFSRIFGGGVQQVADGVATVGRVFVGDKAARDTLNAKSFEVVHDQFAGEFNRQDRGWFDAFVDGLNRLPRPILAMSTLFLFGYAMNDPVGFTARMQGLQHVPDPLWWLMGTIVAFYFGARETHHARQFKAATRSEVQQTVKTIREIEALDDDGEVPSDAGPVTDNPALDAWRSQ